MMRLSHSMLLVAGWATAMSACSSTSVNDSQGKTDAGATGGSGGSGGATTSGGSGGTPAGGGTAGSAGGAAGAASDAGDGGGATGLACSPASPCPNGAYCDYPTTKCGLDAQQGTCKQKPAPCATPIQPVCGCDAQYHDNACSAHAVGFDDAPGFCNFCPPDVPANGSKCFNDQLACTYGTSPRLDCRQTAKCEAGAWNAPLVACTGTGLCPATFPTHGNNCSYTGAPCVFNNTVCDCECPPIGPCTSPKWICAPPPAGCPNVAPNAGQPCTGTQTCVYGACGLDFAKEVSCAAGLWKWTDVQCPQ